MKRLPVMAVILMLSTLAWCGAMLYQAGYKDGVVYSHKAEIEKLQNSHKAAIEKAQNTEIDSVEVPGMTPPSVITQTDSE